MIKQATCKALMTALSSSTMTESSREKRSPALERSFLSSTCKDKRCFVDHFAKMLFFQYAIIEMTLTCSNSLCMVVLWVSPSVTR